MTTRLFRIRFVGLISRLLRPLAIAVALGVGSLHAAQLTLQWTDNSNNEAQFKIERSLTNNPVDFAQIATVTRNTTTYVDTAVTVGTQYFYRVRASNVTGDSGYTSIESGIAKETPTITVLPVGSAIVFGQQLSASTLVGGVAMSGIVPVPGTFAYTSPTNVPSGAGNTTVSVTFTPTDTAGYNTVTASIDIVVSKATPTITTSPSATAITFGQALSASTLSGGVGSVAGTFAFTTPGSIPAGAGTPSVGITFTPTDSANFNNATGTISITVNKATPTITTPPSATAITFGQALSASTLSGGVGSVAGTFAFTAPGTIPAGAGAPSVGITFTPTDGANYNTATASITVTVNKATPTITTPPTATAITFGQAFSASTLSGGSASVAGTFTFTAAATVPASAGVASAGITFTPTDSANYNTATGTTNVTVNKANPTITTPPTATAITFGQALSASTLSGGSGSVAGTFAFTAPTTIPAAAGTAAFSVTFSPTDSTNYNTVTGSTNVTVNPAAATITLGDLNVTFDGSPKAASVVTNPVGLATTVTYNASATIPSAVGTYTVVATITDPNYTGTATDTLTIGSADPNAPAFTTHPADATIIVGQNTMFTVAATGTPAPTFQWQFRTGVGNAWQNVTDDANYSGATTVQLTLTNAPLSFNGRQYKAVATNIHGAISSNVATLTVNGVAPAFTTNPVSQTIVVGTSHSFTVVVTGTPTPTVLWETSPDGVAGWTAVVNDATYSGAATATLTITNASLALTGRAYRAVATNAVSSTTSAIATLTVNGIAPSFTTHPQNQSIFAGGSTTLSVVAAGTPTPAVKWQISTNNGVDWTDVTNNATFSGATTTSLSITSAALALSGNRFRAVATNVISSANSNVAILTVSEPPPPPPPPEPTFKITSTATATAVAGVPFSFALQTSEPATEFSALNLPTGLSINATTGVISGTFAQTGSYPIGVRAANATDVATSLLIVTVNALPSISSQPQDAQVKVGATAVLSVVGTGSPAPTYQWRKNGSDILGATGATLVLVNFKTSDAGAYTVVLQNAAGTTESRITTIGVESTEKVEGQAAVVKENIVHPNGNVYDQVLLNGQSAAFTADTQQVTRISFIDLNNDIVQVEYSGAGTVSLSLAGSSGPALPVNYNQDVAYMKGHATLVVTGANVNSHLSVFTVGTATAVDQSLFKANVSYDGVADLAAIVISSTDGKFGGLRLANASFFADSGQTGIEATGVEFTGPVFVGDISATGTASPMFLLGKSVDVRVTGGDFTQVNGRPVRVSGITQLRFTDGTTSHGKLLPAQLNKGRFEQDGIDVTGQIVVNP